MKTRIAVSFLSILAILAGGCTSTSITTANGTQITRTSIGTNTQLAKLTVDLKTDGSGSASIEGLNSDQATTTNALIVAMAKALAASTAVAAPVATAATVAK